MPEGPVQTFAANFNLKTPRYVATLPRRHDTFHTQVQPDFTVNEMSMSPLAKGEESDLTAVLAITPMLTLDMRILDSLDFSAGAGLQTYLEGNVQTGSFAIQSCNAGETKLSMRLGSGLKVFYGGSDMPVGPWNKKEVYYKCV